MRRVLLMACAACGALGLATAANASVIPVLDTITPSGSDFEYSYSGTLAGDQGLVPGSELVIFDFAGYIAGSISAGIYSSDVLAFTEGTSTLTPPFGITDDPLISNLVFKWIGAPFNASGGPFADVDFAGLTAKSSFGSTKVGTFTALTVTNNGKATGLLATNGGFVAVPLATVPEMATWTMLILGFGGAGAMVRRRNRQLA